MTRSVLVLIAVLVAILALIGTASAQSPYQFKLGFKALADQIPEVVGQPIEDEHWGDNGDSLQRTTTGLMAWRKADNWTAFTNGSRTWVNGPMGVMERGNEERFAWEAGTVPAPPPGPRMPATVEELPAYLEGFLPPEAKGKVELVGGFPGGGRAVSAYFQLSNGSSPAAQKYARDFVFAAYGSEVPLVSVQIVMLRSDGSVGLSLTLGDNVARILPENTWTDATMDPGSFIVWMKNWATVAGSRSGADRAYIAGPWAE